MATDMSPRSSDDHEFIKNIGERYCDKVKTTPKDNFIESLLIDSNHNESLLSAVRNCLFNKAQRVDGFPEKQLIKRRKTRVGVALEQKLCCDCYKLCIFLNGGTIDELSDMFVCEKQNNTDILSSQSSEYDKTNLSQTKSSNVMRGKNE